jgi:hypothetical protein
MFNVKGDYNARHNLQNEPLLDPVTGALFLLGIAICLARARNSSYFLLLAALVVLMLPGVLSREEEAPQSLRSILATPAVALLAALPLVALWDIAKPKARTSPEGEHAGDVRKYLIGGVAALGIAFVLAQVAYRNYDTYFHDQLESPDSWTAQDSDVTFVAAEMKRLGPDYRYILSSWYASRPTLPYIAPGAPAWAEYRNDIVGDLPLAESEPTVLFLEGSKQDDVYWLLSLCPNASVWKSRRRPSTKSSCPRRTSTRCAGSRRRTGPPPVSSPAARPPSTSIGQRRRRSRRRSRRAGRG